MEQANPESPKVVVLTPAVVGEVPPQQSNVQEGRFRVSGDSPTAEDRYSVQEKPKAAREETEGGDDRHELSTRTHTTSANSESDTSTKHETTDASRVTSTETETTGSKTVSVTENVTK